MSQTNDPTISSKLLFIQNHNNSAVKVGTKFKQTLNNAVATKIQALARGYNTKNELERAKLFSELPSSPAITPPEQVRIVAMPSRAQSPTHPPYVRQLRNCVIL